MTRALAYERGILSGRVSLTDAELVLEQMARTGEWTEYSQLRNAIATRRALLKSRGFHALAAGGGR